jgi:hypothetical protein
LEEEKHYDFLSGITKSLFWTRLLIAVILLLIGGLAAYNIIIIAARLLLEKEIFPLVKIITENNPEGFLFKINNDVLSLSSPFSTYIVIMIVLSIVLNISVRIIKLGVNMISLDLKYCIQTLVKEREDMRSTKIKKPDVYIQIPDDYFPNGAIFAGSVGCRCICCVC